MNNGIYVSVNIKIAILEYEFSRLEYFVMFFQGAWFEQ